VTGEYAWLWWVVGAAAAVVVVLGFWAWRKGQPFASVETYPTPNAPHAVRIIVTTSGVP